MLRGRRRTQVPAPPGEDPTASLAANARPPPPARMPRHATNPRQRAQPTTPRTRTHTPYPSQRGVRRGRRDDREHDALRGHAGEDRHVTRTVTRSPDHTASRDANPCVAPMHRACNGCRLQAGLGGGGLVCLRRCLAGGGCGQPPPPLHHLMRAPSPPHSCTIHHPTTTTSLHTFSRPVHPAASHPHHPLAGAAGAGRCGAPGSMLGSAISAGYNVSSVSDGQASAGARTPHIIVSVTCGYVGYMSVTCRLQVRAAHTLATTQW